MPQRGPKAMHCDDYDSDTGSIKPGTRKEATRRRATTSSRAPPKALDRYRTTARDGASDSGYSSHASTQASNDSATVRAAPTTQRTSMPPPPRPTTAQGATRRPPIIHSDTQRSRDKTTAPPSPTKTREPARCDGVSCQHPGCIAWRNRRYSASQEQAAQYAQYAAQLAAQYGTTPAQYQATTPGYQNPQYAQAPTNQSVATPRPQSRPRSGSSSRSARPVSFHGYSMSSIYGNPQQGPPPSASAYQNMQYAAWVQAYQQQQLQQQAYQQASQAAPYGTTPPTQTISFYPQQSPTATSPTSPNYARQPSLTRTYSARTANPGPEASQQQYSSTGLNRTYSARQANPRTSRMPGGFPDDAEYSESVSSSEDDSSEDSDEQYERNYRSRARDSKLMASTSSSQRRPSMPRQYATAPVIPTTSSRDFLERHREAPLDYISSSDNMDSDRTARAVVDRPRTTYTGSSKSSRRPSVSTNASGRTKSTAVSSTSGYADMIVEGRRGRKSEYLSKVDQARLGQAQQARLEEYTRQQLENQRLQDDIENYQDAVRGGPNQTLTAENIRKKELRTSGSHMSVHSRKTSRSSSKVPNPDGIKIESNGTVIHVYGDTKVEMRAGAEGGTSFVIGGGGASGRDSTYHSNSKSSGSRTGRSRGGSDIGSRRRETIRENDVYEQVMENKI